MRTVIALLITAGLAGTAAAQTAPAAPPAPAAAPAGEGAAMQALVAADANKDGKWDKAEWLAAGRREMGFNFIDADKDGFVTKDELKAGVAKARAMGLAR